MTDELATFVDRYTMRHERTYPHPIERVWEAVTTAEHLDAWMLPVCQVEARLGGSWSFTFADPDGVAMEGVIVEFDPPRVVDYGGMRFELETVTGGTRLVFVQSFPPEFRQDQSTVPVGDPGGDLPAGPDTPWRPGFVAGFHGMLDGLGRHLDGTLEPQPYIDGVHPHHKGVYDPDWVRMCQLYRQHIRTTIPGGVSGK